MYASFMHSIYFNQNVYGMSLFCVTVCHFVLCSMIIYVHICMGCNFSLINRQGTVPKISFFSFKRKFTYKFSIAAEVFIILPTQLLERAVGEMIDRYISLHTLCRRFGPAMLKEWMLRKVVLTWENDLNKHCYHRLIELLKFLIICIFLPLMPAVLWVKDL